MSRAPISDWISRSAALALLAVGVAGCPTTGPEPDPAVPPPSPDWCEDGRAVYRYDVGAVDALTTFPDDHLTRPDPSTATGLRVQMSVSEVPSIGQFPSGYLNVFDEISTLDGFGTTAGAVFRFDYALDAASLTAESVGFVAFTEEGPVRIGAEPFVSDLNSLVILRPHTPLPPATRAAAAIFGPATSSDGSCIRPGEPLRRLLSPATELDADTEPDPLAPRYAEAAAAFGQDLGDIAAMTVFTTQSSTATSLAIQEDIAGRAPAAFEGPWVCVPNGDRTRCDAAITLNDYRDGDRVVPADGDRTPLGSHTLPVALWLPGDGASGPYPLVLYGHGLGGDRSQGGSVSSFLAPEGLAVLAIDAVEHGDHPSRTSMPLPALDPLSLFAIQIDPPGISGLVLRDNFRQSSYDKLQLVASLLEHGVDVDGDGVDDVDTDRLFYVGVSLGGLMGPEVIALTDAFRGALLSVPGGRVTSIIRDSELLSPVIDMMRPEGTSDADVDTFFPILQTIVDAGDPAVWAPAMTDRLVPANRHGLPQVLFQFALDDGIVPNSANVAIASASGLPAVGTEVFTLPVTEWVDGPLSGNLADGGSGGIQQFDIVTDRQTPGEDPHPATHDNVTRSHEGLEAAKAFFLPVLDGDPGVVVDPYAE